jgi:hypothetical protein
MKWSGRDQLSKLLKANGVSLEWERFKDRYRMTVDGAEAVVDWWPKTGSIRVQGKDEERVTEMVERALREGQA